MSASDAGDRFARWPRSAAIAVLAAFALLLGLAVATAKDSPANPTDPARVASETTASGKPRIRDADLHLYERIAERVAAGDNYYAAAMEEQRLRDFPVKPGFAVRLPTLAYIAAGAGEAGRIVLAWGLFLAVAAAWWRRLGVEQGVGERRIICLMLLTVGSILALKPQYLVLHEVWAGLFMALSFGLHRPGKWAGAWLAAAMALAIREHALPFVLLMAAMALWRRDWRETAAWVALVALFFAAMALHLSAVSQHALPTDPESPPWLVFRGLRGWTSNLQLTSVLQYLPDRLAAPIALLPLIGWAGWRSAAGLFGTLLHAGYGLLFMLAGRDNNFYWAVMIIPTWFIGLAFTARSIRSLWHTALGKT